MYILGLHNDEDSGVCLLRDGKIVDLVNEERFTRVKLHKGFLRRCVEYVLAKNGLELKDIAYFAYGWYGTQNDWPRHLLKLAQRAADALCEDPQAATIFVDRLNVEIAQDTATRSEFEQEMRAMGVPDQAIVYLDHHKSHAWSEFSCSSFERAAVFTFDGRGDLKSSSVSYATRSEGVEELDYLLTYDSLGFLYGQITQHLGFSPHRHEGKVTGLAAYGDPRKTLPTFRKMFTFEDGTIRSRLGMYRPFFSALHPEIGSDLAKHSREDIAAGLQAHCEDLLVRFVGHWLRQIYGSAKHDVCLAGGVFANVKINHRIAEIESVNDVFIFPHMGDGGLPLGAAMQLVHSLTGQTSVEFGSPYWGPAYTDQEITAALDRSTAELQVSKMTDKVGPTVEDLMASRVVGYFDGRMEFGPRALGARSILYHAKDPTVNDWLNKRMSRTEFMPFAPVIPEEYSDQCYVGWKPSHLCARFMTRAYECLPEFSAIHKAVVHVDGTARPQTVREDVNGDYYRVVKHYCERTGERALINTSFNRHEEPIVCTPDDAVGALDSGMIDVLVIGPFRAVRRFGKEANRATRKASIGSEKIS